MSGELNMFSTYFLYRIAILGEPRVGKTSILNQLVNQTFNERYEPTLETDMEYLHEYKGTTYVCLIVDTAGVKEFPAMRHLSMTRSNGFIVVFDLSIEETFDKAKETIDEVLHVKKDQFINIILIGNKNDSISDENTASHLNDSARNLRHNLDSNNHINCHYFELSAKSNEQITTMFEKLLDLFDMKHLREGSHLIASLRNRRNRIPLSERNAETSRLSGNVTTIGRSSDVGEKQKKRLLPMGMFSSPNLSDNRKASSSNNNSSNLLLPPENDFY